MEQADTARTATGQVTRLLHAWSDGDKDAEQALMSIAYSQLHTIALRRMSGERPNHTLCPTELVHEMWMRLDGSGVAFSDRAHFLALSSSIMRRILVDHARARSRKKRLGAKDLVEFVESEMAIVCTAEPEQLIDLDRALAALSQQDPRKGRLMEMTYFGGLTPSEAAEVLDMTVRTVQRDLKFAKAWMRAALKSHAITSAVPAAI